MNHYGELREPVHIVREGRTPTGTRDAQATRELVARAWAKVLTVKGSERIGAVNAGEGPTHRLVIRYQSGIEAGMFVVLGDRAYKILDVENEDERNVWLDLLVRDDRSA